MRLPWNLVGDRKSQTRTGQRSRSGFFDCLIRYNCTFFAPQSARRSHRIMDAERINAVEYALDDLDQRAAELRRYL
jgi:hypothetical protein